MGIASFVLGIVGIVLSCIGIGGVIGLVGLPLGIISLINKKRKAQSIVGIVLCSLSIVITVFMFYIALTDDGTVETSSETEEIITSTEENTVTEEIKKVVTPEEIKEKYVNSCSEYDYKEIARNPDNYRGKRVKFRGQVIQVSEGWSNSITLRINVTEDEYGFYDDTIYCTYKYSENESKILEDDIVTIYGECKGDTSYTSVLGTIVTLPEVSIKYIDIEV